MFGKGNKLALLIPTIEALAILEALKIHYGSAPFDDIAKVVIFPSQTDIGATGRASINVCLPSSTVKLSYQFLRSRARLGHLLINSEKQEVVPVVSGAVRPQEAHPTRQLPN